jgi:hypothetical protein
MASILSALLDHIRRVPAQLDSWGGPIGSLPAAAILAFVGFLALDRDRQLLAARIVVPVIGLTLGSVLFVSPSHGPTAFTRNGIAFSLALIGGAAFSLIRLGASAVGALAPSSLKWSKSPSFMDRIPRPAQWFAVALGVVLVAQGGARAVTAHIDRSKEHYFWLRDANDKVINPDQIALMQRHAGSGDRIIYFDWVGLQYFLSHGGMQRGAIYFPMLEGTPEADRWLQDPRIRLAIHTTPVEDLAVSKLAALSALHVDRVTIEADAERLTRLRLWIENPGRATELRASSSSIAGKERVIPIPPRSTGWVSIGVDSSSTRVEILLPKQDYLLRVAGISTGATTFWPWNEPVKVAVALRDKAETVPLDF